MENNSQLSFNFSKVTTPESKQDKRGVTPKKTETIAAEVATIVDQQEMPKLKPRAMKRAILAWLIPQTPSGMALNVPTRVSKYCSDVAAFWSSPSKKRLMTPAKTLIVEIRKNREQCWPDCSRQEELLPLLRKMKKEKASIEAILRREEPELKENDTLFPEFESWNYKLTKKRKYHTCLKQLEEIEHALYKGSRFEQIRRAHVADYLYLAVPTGTVLPNELADGWGLININPDMTTEVVKEAEKWECQDQNKLHLIQHIAAGCKKSLLFSLGVNELANGKASFTPIPIKRRAKKSSVL